MSNHLTRVGFERRPEDQTLEEERRRFREKHISRERRLQLKDRNSMQLLGIDGGAVGDGIVPMVAKPSQNPYAEIGSRPSHRGVSVSSSSSSTGSWREFNPIGVAASQTSLPPGDSPDSSSIDTAAAGGGVTFDEVEYMKYLQKSEGRMSSVASEWRDATLETLCLPDLSVYEAEHDFRVSSEEVERLSMNTEARSRSVAGLGMMADVTFEGDEESSGLAKGRHHSLPPQSQLQHADGQTLLSPNSIVAQLRQRMSEEEEIDHDDDYAMSFYHDGDIDPLS